MGYVILFFTLWENRRLLGLLGVTIAVIPLVQYAELPYANVISSLFSASQVLAVRELNSTSSDNRMQSQSALKQDLNSDITSAVHENDPDCHIVSDREVASNKYFREHLHSNSSLFDNFTARSVNNSAFEFATEEQGKCKQSYPAENATIISSLRKNLEREHDTKSSGMKKSLAANVSLVAQENSSLQMVSPAKIDSDNRNQVEPISFGSSSLQKGAKQSLEKLGLLQKSLNRLGNSSSINSIIEKHKHETPKPTVISIAEMNELLFKSRVSYQSKVSRWSSGADKELLYAKSQIERAPIISSDLSLYVPLFRNFSVFKRSYELMEEMLKVYIYREGKKPIFHHPGPVLEGIYASEGWFMKQLESNTRFLTNNPEKAHLFYLSFSSRILKQQLSLLGLHSHKNRIKYLENYVDMVAAKHPFWNRTGGADHFLVACHDWMAPGETSRHLSHCIRALCNADIKEGFTFGKDVSLPETYVRLAKDPLRDLGGKPPSKRKILAFFAGKMHGYLRPILLQHWGNKDHDMKIFGPMHKVKGDTSYIRLMKSSKYCICARGYEVNSPRVVEAIFYECVPVIISDNFVPPFFEVLNWESFAVFILEKDIPKLKKILLSIPKKRYRQMQMRVKKVQQHFLWHPKPVKYDIFHMILHSIWYNRVLQTRLR